MRQFIETLQSISMLTEKTFFIISLSSVGQLSSCHLKCIQQLTVSSSTYVTIINHQQALFQKRFRTTGVIHHFSVLQICVIQFIITATATVTFNLLIIHAYYKLHWVLGRCLQGNLAVLYELTLVCREVMLLYSHRHSCIDVTGIQGERLCSSCCLH